MTGDLELHDAHEHNLAGISVRIPRGALTVVTGVSGSGKSSLVFDTLHAACERRWLETLSAHARRFLQRLPAPAVGAVRGLSPSIAVGQRRSGDHARSTVGTLSGVHDALRFWFAKRTGLEPRDLSFVSAGACPECRGLGVVERVDRDLLVADGRRTLRQGALVPTTPTGYVVYSQVTVDVLDTVCRAHGFDVDTPWNELTREQQDVVFYGSDRVEVPFGKHSLESRMRWSGITAKPRELGHYKGLIPTIEEILRRSRNENALRFARSLPCEACGGSRLGAVARDAVVDGVSIVDAVRWTLPELAQWCEGRGDDELLRAARRLRTCERLGLSHLTCERATSSLSGGEHQRLRLAAVATEGLAGVTFVFDEPSIGLHAAEEHAVLDLLGELRDAGNTVVVVEHSEHALRRADHLIDLGPGAGAEGGRLLFAGPPAQLGAAPRESHTRAHYADDGELRGQALRQRRAVDEANLLTVRGITRHNLIGVDATFALGRLNVVSGVAGAGKSTLVAALVEAVRAGTVEGAAVLTQVVHVDQQPIGRTPRSNPATYTGLFDEVRKRFAGEPAARERGFTATTFSCNTKDGGRCEACEGSGREVVGMHGLPPVELVCAVCGGRRFRDDVLAVTHRGLSILDVLDATVDRALEVFGDDERLAAVLRALQQVGLGYLQLGQPATTLSGGEAQRVKLAGELARGGERAALFVLEEPTIGLHRADVALLLRALDGLVDRGHTVVLVEHDLDVLRGADRLLDVGPGAGPAGGRICGEGDADAIARLDTPTGRALRGEFGAVSAGEPSRAGAAPHVVQLRGVTTHNLRDVDVDLPARGFTVVTGVSGSGKTSLVFDTLAGEARARLTEHLSGHVQRQLGTGGARARSLHSAAGLRPVVALAQRTEADAGADRRATVATTTELHGLLRLCWSRAADDGEVRPAASFSFFRREGACPGCAGRGVVERCDPARLIADPTRPLFDGALDPANKVVRDFADPTIRHRAVLEAVAAQRGIDLTQPFGALDAAAQHALLDGCGDEVFDVVWQHDGAERDAEHRFRSTWPGIAGTIDAEYARRQQSGAKGRAEHFAALLREQRCSVCAGDRLAEPMRAVRLGGVTLPETCRRSVDELRDALTGGLGLDARRAAIVAEPFAELVRQLQQLQALGLGHLTLDRSTATLSAGERQRARLARQLAAPLADCLYVLDEPTLGLHPRDRRGLLDVIRGLCAAGNGVIAVEHDPVMAAAADFVVEVGPGPGEHGGTIVAAAPPAELPAASRTARLLAAAPRALRDAPRRAATGLLRVRGATLHHLRGLTVALPIGALTVVTGVSGSGKTSLVRGVLAASLRAGRPIGCAGIEGLGGFATIVEDAGARAGRSRSQCVATLLPVFDELKKQFAASAAAKQAGMRASHFSFAGKSGGACRACSGVGHVRSDFDFLGADAWQVCDVCDGRRYDEATLAVRWCERSIADVLESTVEALLQLLDEHAVKVPKLRAPLQLAAELGLGYLRLGQAADTLSGGEAQRLAVAAHLSARTKRDAPTLFLLDEPTRGLHPDDVQNLLRAFERLLDDGHTIVAVEHDLDVIAAADHVLDLGPGAGAAGGALVAWGTPTAVAHDRSSATGAVLRGSR
ncbi:MAG: ATP-binding cassette domain-containing protein [Planctomycetota bacterium]